jgi:hypothetical protein
MTWVFNTNNVFSGANDSSGAIFIEWKTLAISSGCMEIIGSGDGLSAFQNLGQTSGPYDVLTAGVSVWNSGVPNEFSNPLAWMRMRFVGLSFEFIVQRRSGTSSIYEDEFAIRLSPTGFTSGGANSTTPPTATDEQYLLGSASTWTQFGFHNINNKVQVGFDDSPGYQGFHSFYLVNINQSGNVTYGVWAFDVMDQYLANDLQPWVCFIEPFSQNTLTYPIIINSTSARSRMYRDYGGGAESFNLALGYILTDSTTSPLFPGSAPASPEDGNARSIPIIWGNRGISYFKGVSSIFQWKGTNTRGYPDTANLATTGAKLYVDDVLIPWEQYTIPA